MRQLALIIAFVPLGAFAAEPQRPRLAEHQAAVSEEPGTPPQKRALDRERRAAERNAGKLETYLGKLLKDGKDLDSDPEARWALGELADEHAYSRDAGRLLGRPPAKLARPDLSRLGPGASRGERRGALRSDIAKLTAYVVKADAYGVDATREREALTARRGELIKLHGLPQAPRLGRESAGVPGDLRDAPAGTPRMNPAGLPALDYKPKPYFENRDVPGPDKKRGPVPAVEADLFKTAKEAMFGTERAGPGASRWSTIVDKYARQYHVPPRLVLAVIDAESNGNPNAKSPVGARGLMQLMPATARGLGFSPSQLNDPDTNIHAGVKYLSQLLARYHGDARLAVAAYNAGEGAVDKYGGVPPYKETRNYVKKVMENYG